MRLRSRIERLERRQGLVTGGRIPIAVLDRVIDGTISEREYNRYRSRFEQIIAAAEGVTPEPGLLHEGRNGWTT